MVTDLVIVGLETTGATNATGGLDFSTLPPLVTMCWASSIEFVKEHGLKGIASLPGKTELSWTEGSCGGLAL